MKQLRRIVPIVLVICMFFTTTAFGAVKKPDKVEIVSVEGSSVGVTVKFKPQGNSIRYKLYFSEDEDFGYESVYVNKSGSVFQMLDANTTYYIKMRAYKDVKGKRYWGPYSSVYTVTTKKPKPDMFMTIRKINNSVFTLGIYPSDYGYPVTLNLTSAYLYDTTTGEILTKLNPDLFSNAISGAQPEYKKVEDDVVKINNNHIATFSFKTKTGNYTLDETKYGIMLTGKYNGNDYIFKVARHEMKYMKIKWENGYVEK